MPRIPHGGQGNRDALSQALDKASTLFVGRLPRGVPSDELAAVFSTVGPLRQVIPSRETYLFVEYADVSIAGLAASVLNGKYVNGSRIVVVPATQLRKLFIGNVDRLVPPAEIHALIAAAEPGLLTVEVFEEPAAGPVGGTGGRGRGGTGGGGGLGRSTVYGGRDSEQSGAAAPAFTHRGFCFAEFATHEAAHRALWALADPSFALPAPSNCPPGGPLLFRTVKVDWAEPPHEVEEGVMANVRVLYVSNLPPAVGDAPEALLCRIFEEYGPIERVKRLKNFAFVHYASRADAEAALTGAQGTILGGHAIRIQWSKPPPSSLLPPPAQNIIVAAFPSAHHHHPSSSAYHSPQQARGHHPLVAADVPLTMPPQEGGPIDYRQPSYPGAASYFAGGAPPHPAPPPQFPYYFYGVPRPPPPSGPTDLGRHRSGGGSGWRDDPQALQYAQAAHYADRDEWVRVTGLPQAHHYGAGLLPTNEPYVDAREGGDGRQRIAIAGASADQQQPWITPDDVHSQQRGPITGAAMNTAWQLGGLIDALPGFQPQQQQPGFQNYYGSPPIFQSPASFAPLPLQHDQTGAPLGYSLPFPLPPFQQWQQPSIQTHAPPVLVQQHQVVHAEAVDEHGNARPAPVLMGESGAVANATIPTAVYASGRSLSLGNPPRDGVLQSTRTYSFSDAAMPHYSRESTTHAVVADDALPAVIQRPRASSSELPYLKALRQAEATAALGHEPSLPSADAVFYLAPQRQRSVSSPVVRSSTLLTDDSVQNVTSVTVEARQSRGSYVSEPAPSMTSLLVTESAEAADVADAASTVSGQGLALPSSGWSGGDATALQPQPPVSPVHRVSPTNRNSPLRAAIPADLLQPPHLQQSLLSLSPTNRLRSSSNVSGGGVAGVSGGSEGLLGGPAGVRTISPPYSPTRQAAIARPPQLWSIPEN